MKDAPKDAMGVIQGATIAGLVATGKRACQRARRVQQIQVKEYKLPKLCSTFRRYNRHCGVVISARDRKDLEGLGRYILRPLLAKDGLNKGCGNEYELKLKTPWADGTTSLRLSSMELLERLPSCNLCQFTGRDTRIFKPRCGTSNYCLSICRNRAKNSIRIWCLISCTK